MEEKFCNFALKQAFHGINSVIGTLILLVRVLMFSLVRILLINFCKLGQITKNTNFNITKSSHYTVYLTMYI